MLYADTWDIFESKKIIDDIMDASEMILYKADTKILTLHDTTDIYTTDDDHVANIRRKLLSLHDRQSSGGGSSSGGSSSGN